MLFRKSKFKNESVLAKTVWGLLITLLILIAFSQIIPLWWAIINSFKTPIEYITNSIGLPEKLSFKNYIDIFGMLKVKIFKPGEGFYQYGFGTMMFNSFLLAALSPVMGILSSSCTAYIVCKYNFRGKKFLLTLNIFVMIIPFVGTLPASLTLNKAIGRYDNFLLMMLLGHSPFGFALLFYFNSFRNIPWDYAEAAFIDGASHYRVMFQIMMPMRFSTILVMYVLGFLGSWNDYMTPLIWLPSYPNLALGIYKFQYDAAVNEATMPQILAGFIIVAIPSVILYLVCQKGIASKLAVGGLKG